MQYAMLLYVNEAGWPKLTPAEREAGTAAYPELRVVAVMHGDRLSYADTFEGAIAGLIDPVPHDQAVATTGEATPSAEAADVAREANAAFERYLGLHSEKRFSEAAVELDRLQRALQKLQAVPPDGGR